MSLMTRSLGSGFVCVFGQYVCEYYSGIFSRGVRKRSMLEQITKGRPPYYQQLSLLDFINNHFILVYQSLFNFDVSNNSLA